MPTGLLIDDYILYKLLIEPPVALGKMLFDSIHDTCMRELTDEGTVHEKILELQLRYELGEMAEEEYKKEETKLMSRLRKIKKAKQEEMWGKDTGEDEEASKEDKGNTPINKKEIGEGDNPETDTRDGGGDDKKEYI